MPFKCLQKAVTNDPVNGIVQPVYFANFIAIVDEEGLLKENPKVNTIASLRAKQTLVGNVAMLSPKQWKQIDKLPYELK